MAKKRRVEWGAVLAVAANLGAVAGAIMSGSDQAVAITGFVVLASALALGVAATAQRPKRILVPRRLGVLVLAGTAAVCVVLFSVEATRSYLVTAATGQYVRLEIANFRWHGPGLTCRYEVDGVDTDLATCLVSEGLAKRLQDLDGRTDAFATFEVQASRLVTVSSVALVVDSCHTIAGMSRCTPTGGGDREPQPATLYTTSIAAGCPGRYVGVMSSSQQGLAIDVIRPHSLAFVCVAVTTEMPGIYDVSHLEVTFNCAGREWTRTVGVSRSLAFIQSREDSLGVSRSVPEGQSTP